MLNQNTSKNETEGNTKRNTEILTTIVKDDYVMTRWRPGANPTLPRSSLEQVTPVAGVSPADQEQTGLDKTPEFLPDQKHAHNWSFWDHISLHNRYHPPKDRQ